jgi:plastocyanin
VTTLARPLSRLRSLLSVLIVFCLGTLLASCGESAATPTTAASSGGGTPTTATVSGGGEPGTFNVDMVGFKFVPAEITIPAGSTVIWTNKEAPKHTVTEDNGAFDSGTMEKGATFSRKFDTAGTVGYYCKFHGSAGQGMFGHIIVTEAAVVGEATPTAAGTSVAVVDTPTVLAEEATATTVASQPTGPLGFVRFSDNLGLSDRIVLTINAMPERPTGKAFYAWLTNAGETNTVSLGRLTPDANNSVSLKYDDPASGNLLATYDTFLITTEDLESVPASPSADVVLGGQLPPKALIHIRHLLVSFDATPKKIGLEVGLRGQVDLVRQHAGFMNDAQSSGNLAAVKLHAEHLVNIIEGAKGANYGDLNKDGKVTNPGDGFGLLPNGDQLGYLQGSKDHAELAAGSADATADIKLHAGHVGITVDNVSGWVTTIRDRSLEVVRASDLKATEPLVREIVALSGQALNGVDLQGDGQILPVPGSGGAITSYQHAQLMASIPLQAQAPGEPAATTEPAATAAPAATTAPAPTATSAPSSSSGNGVTIEVKNFTFGDPLTVKVGTTVTWTNLDDAPHTVTADDNSFDSKEFLKGQSFSFTFNKAGEFSYYCAVHGAPGGQGMASKITVQP